MEEDVGLLIAVIAPETEYSLILLVLRGVEGISFTLFES